MTTGKLGNESVTGAKLSASILGQLVRNVTYVTAKSAKNKTEDPKRATALPDRKAGDRRRGPYPLLPSNNEKVAMTQTAPVFESGKATGWFAQARPIGGADPVDWEIEVHAVCAEL